MWQFSLLSLIMSTVLLALSLAAFGGWGILVGPILLAIVGRCRGVVAWNATIGSIGLILLAIGLLVPVLNPVDRTDIGMGRVECLHTLQRIDFALLGYEAEHGKFPPVRESDRQGNPPHSWRYSILPYLDAKELFKKYNRDEPWNGPNNSKLAGEMSRLYTCPSDDDAFRQARTSYFAVVGADGSWLPHGSSQSANTWNPAILIEMRGLAVGCLEPRDVSVDEICEADDDAVASHEKVRHGFLYDDRSEGTAIVFADGYKRFLPTGLPRDVLRAVLLGDRDVQGSLDQYAHWRLQIHWPKCLSLASLVACFVVMVFWRKKSDADEDDEMVVVFESNAMPPQDPPAEPESP